MEGQIHSFTKRENIAELDSQQSFSWGELEEKVAWLLLGTIQKGYLFPPSLNLLLVKHTDLGFWEC